jgi:hypothetical protein
MSSGNSVIALWERGEGAMTGWEETGSWTMMEEGSRNVPISLVKAHLN